MSNKHNRREFLKQSTQGMLGAATSIGGVEQLVEKFSGISAPKAMAKGAGNPKSAAHAIALPEGGGAVQGIGEKFQANPFTGTANFSVPIYTSTGRSDFGPKLELQYSSGNGNGIFGHGWGFSFPKISRKTAKGIPSYKDDQDVFLLSGAEDLVPILNNRSRKTQKRSLNGKTYDIYYYRPRVEGLFARIEFWRDTTIDQRSSKSFWRIITKENVTSIYGCNPSSQLKHPEKKQVFEWMLELTYDAKGNYILYACKEDKAGDVETGSPYIPAFEAHRTFDEKVFQVYLQSIRYGNIAPLDSQNFENVINKLSTSFSEDVHFFEVVFDYHLNVNEDNKKLPFQVCGSTYAEASNNHNWNLRNDRFSSYRAGFEIRTYRLCQRVLMFHRLPLSLDDATLGDPVLVRSTDFHYDENPHNGMSTLTKVTQRGYRKPTTTQGTHYSEEYYLDLPVYVYSNEFAIKSFPPIAFTYSTFEPHKQSFQKMSAQDGDMPPNGLNDPNFALVDLFGTGLPDVLNTSPSGYYYWKNHGDGTFSGRRTLDQMPANIRLEMDGVGFGDMAGDGQADLLVHQGNNWGFFETNGKAGWKNFKTYKAFPSFELNDPAVRMLDLTGDGKADILRTDRNSFVWFPCMGEQGFGKPRHIARKRDLAAFPDVDFSSPRVRLADMTGDGLNDIVLVHDGRIDYWANMGNGRFSRRITLENTPRFGAGFDPARLFLTDIDGNGNADLLFVESGKVHFCFNRSGNAWSELTTIKGTPQVTNLDRIQAQDVLGCGCAQILWTSDYKGGGRSHYMYLDFTGGVKPNLLIEMNNNMGSTTKAQYKPSTYFYRLDEKDNYQRNWVSPLPFPVQVLEKVEKIDHISRTKLITKYRYHHGFYDGKEREFRGFAFVEQWDTEVFDVFKEENLHQEAEKRNTDRSYHVPPVLTKTWFHTGMHQSDDLEAAIGGFDQQLTTALEIHRHFREDYYAGGQHDFDLENTLLDASVGPIDRASMSEAYRALRGQVLRQELYAEDDSDKADQPYTVTESNAKVVLVQPKHNNRHAVYFVHPHESLSYHFERKMDDPRVVQELTLEVDPYGNVLESVSIAYPRKKHYTAYVETNQTDGVIADSTPQEQEWYKEQFKILGTYQLNRFKNEDVKQDYYNIGVPYESKSFELTALETLGFQWFKKDEGKWVEAFKSTKLKPGHFDKGSADSLEGKLSHLEFQATPANDQLGLRLLNWSQSYFKADENAEILEITPQNTCPIRTYTARLPLGEIDSLLLPYETYQAAFSDNQIQTLFADRFPTPSNLENLLCEAGYTKMHHHWWVPSGQQAFIADQFYLPTISCDPFGYRNTVRYDTFNLLMRSSTNARQQVVEVRKNDYIALQPSFIIDPNGNGAKVAFDALGLVAASAIMEKPNDNDRPTQGDPMLFFSPVWEYDELIPYADTTYRSGDGSDAAGAYLQDASTAMIYDLWAHLRKKLQGQANEPPVVYSITREQHYLTNPKSPIQRQLIYFDGLGREVQTKIEATPDANGQKRWIGSGWKIYNNKGKVVRQFEPFYTLLPDFEDIYEQALAGNYGVSPIIFYDPLERVVATIHPDGSFEKVAFSAWQQETWDRNDTVNWTPATESWISNWWTLNGPTLPDGTTNPMPFKTWKERIIGDRTIDPSTINLNNPNLPAEDAVLRKTMVHAETPTIAHLDSLGRPFLTIAQNRQNLNERIEAFKTYVDLDVQGNDLAITDPMGKTLFRHEFNMLQQQLLVDSADAGIKYALLAVDEQPLWSIDAKKSIIKMEYDPLRRPTRSLVKPYGGNEICVLETTYDDSEVENGIGQVTKIKDQAGIIEHLGFDFKGNIRGTERRLWEDYKGAINLNNDNNRILKKGTNDRVFASSSSYDALNRVISSTAPDGSVFRPAYNLTNQLKALSVDIKGDTPTIFVKSIEYSAKGQRTSIQYGSGVSTSYKYDDFNFRLIKLNSTNTTKNSVLQRIAYVYDPVGNICCIQDAAFEVVFTCNEKIEPTSRYTYDALYRLTEATGRQHLSYTGLEYMNQRKQTMLLNFRCELFQTPNNQRALTSYTQYYNYDKSGNILSIRHCPQNNCARGWTRTQVYGDNNNRIESTASSAAAAYGSTAIQHDENGNITSLPHLENIAWDFANQMRKVQLDATGNSHAYYVYGSDGMRSRKVVESASGTYERLYLHGYEVFIDGTTENTTLHINDDTRQIALVETGSDNSRIKYQLSNHLGSATLETNAAGEHLNYEEYSPYGSSVFIAYSSDRDNQASQTEQKRYRYSGKERDDETGLYYYGARYYAPWMGRWMKADPIGKGDGLNVFGFSKNSPITFYDTDGTYAEAGHYYTVFAVALASGYNPQKAQEIAYFAQQPDEVKMMDAIEAQKSNVIEKIGIAGNKIVDAFSFKAFPPKQNFDIFPNEGPFMEKPMENIQIAFHSLTGRNALEETSFREMISKSYSPFTNTQEFGWSLHALGDSFSHRQLNSDKTLGIIPGDSNLMYVTGFGHLKHGTAPDNIANRKELFRKYVETLGDVMQYHSGKSANVKDLRKLIDKVSNAANEENRINILKQFIQNQNVPSDMLEYQPEKDDFYDISKEEKIRVHLYSDKVSKQRESYSINH